MSSPNFQEGLIRSSKYTRLLSDLFQMRVDLNEGACSVMYELPGMVGDSLDQVYDCILVSNLRFFRHLTADAFKPLKVSLTRSAPQNTTEHEQVFGCPIEFSAQDNRVFFDPEILYLSSLHADPNMLILHEKMADEQIQQIEKQALLVEARRIIGEQLENGSVSLEMLSERLGMKVSRLRAHFAELDTSFNQVLSDYRFELAKKLLTRTEETIDQIVYLTGFSEPSTFYRAFKRWTGSTPIVYREQSRQRRQLED
jgi:AraC-like DNA-binding protein